MLVVDFARQIRLGPTITNSPSSSATNHNISRWHYVGDRNKTFLGSFPRSGNNLNRCFIEFITGVMTHGAKGFLTYSQVHKDNPIAMVQDMKGFVNTSRAGMSLMFVRKTHYPRVAAYEPKQRIIIPIRDPATVALSHRPVWPEDEFTQFLKATQTWVETYNEYPPEDRLLSPMEDLSGQNGKEAQTGAVAALVHFLRVPHADERIRETMEKAEWIGSLGRKKTAKHSAEVKDYQTKHGITSEHKYAFGCITAMRQAYETVIYERYKPTAARCEELAKLYEFNETAGVIFKKNASRARARSFVHLIIFSFVCLCA